MLLVQMQRRLVAAVLLAIPALLPTALVAGEAVGYPGAGGILRLAVTTSTEDSGLLGLLGPAFEAASGVRLHVVATGSGKALRLARDGEVDALLVHSPAAELTFMAEGWGRLRVPIMYNDFVLLGPPGPMAPGILELLETIARTGAAFVSRGDDSGTHIKERQLWRQAGVAPGAGYLSVGQGMAAALRIAAEKQAYVLCDRGTWLALGERLDLQLRSDGSPLLHNPYHAIAVDPERHPHVNFAGASAFIEFLSGAVGQDLIDNFRVRGERLFYPLARHSRAPG